MEAMNRRRPVLPPAILFSLFPKYPTPQQTDPYVIQVGGLSSVGDCWRLCQLQKRPTLPDSRTLIAFVRSWENFSDHKELPFASEHT